MKKLLLVVLFVLPVVCNAQKGLELKLSGGLEYLGIDPWLNGGIITGALIYNFNGVFALGASYSAGINNKFYIDAKSNNYEASISELALDAYINIIRAGKVKVYITAGVGQISGETKEPVPDFINSDNYGPPTLSLKDSSVGFGLGAGGVLNLGGGFYLNFFEYRFRTVSSDFMNMEKGFHGSIGPMHTAKAGLSYVFGAK